MPRAPKKPRQPIAPSRLTALFSSNLQSLMRVDQSLNTQNALAKASKVGQRSIGRLLRQEQSPTLDMVERLAGAFHLEAWQMLVADFDPTNPPITKQIDDQQKEIWRRIREAFQDLATYNVERQR